MMPMPLRRKARNMKKVEILCRTATAEDIANTPQQIRSRLRDLSGAGSRACTVPHCTLQCKGIECQQYHEAKRYAGDAGDAARQQRHDPRARQQADLIVAEAAAQSVAREEGDRDRQHDEGGLETI